MRKQMIENAAYEVATQVRAVEDSIDAALAEIAELQARIMRANAVARAGFGTVHPALEQLAAAVTGLVEARGCDRRLPCGAGRSQGQGPGPSHRRLRRRRRVPDQKTGLADLRIVA